MRKGQHQESQGFPDGSVVKSLPANAGDRGSIPDPGRPHMLGGNQAHSLCSLEPVLRNDRSHHSEQPVQGN